MCAHVLIISTQVLLLHVQQCHTVVTVCGWWVAVTVCVEPCYSEYLSSHSYSNIVLVVHVVAILIRLVVWVGVDCMYGIIKELYSVCAHSGMCQLSA